MSTETIVGGVVAFLQTWTLLQVWQLKFELSQRLGVAETRISVLETEVKIAQKNA